MPTHSLVALLIALTAGALAALIALLSRVAFSPDDGGRGVVVTEFQPPKGVGLFLAANVLGTPLRAAGATILDLAERGVVRIVEFHQGASHPVLGIQYLSQGDATEPERSLLDSIFGHRTRAAADADGSAPVSWLTGRRDAVDRTAVELASSAAGEAVALGLRRGLSPAAVSTAALCAALTFVAGAVAVVEAGSSDFWTILVTMLLAMAGGALAVLGLILVLRHRPLTRDGALMREQLLGLRAYLALAEQQRIQQLHDLRTAPREPNSGAVAVLETREPLLSWAMALGLDVEWSRRLEFGRRRDGV
ncbi:hypothetical protein M2152_000485 [Microbacteriaceae bacterium SG_E_30_P1]|uniref:Predicted membrane protein YciQ-like C-terminal domain-containing protein n=1 Tax=Antiquaquibacter oligotrophicus TaxID=2880260 RepID=A0ABT6KJX4_9MICO|nr:DUF2207 domain-containing protein [Antiquaquibacter oligotrophicus]MDH6180303.1 hypothetical protein [Antiquaquibacter oligotrophicus]UDF13950.1 DUF2207 domain-containing protein [Antiquaquibacter oligotrophicus]